MNTTQFNPKAAYQVTRTIYFSLIIGVLLFLTVTLMTINGLTFFKLDFSDPILIVAIILTLTAIPAGYYFSNQMAKFKMDDPISTKWPVYQVRLIIRMATCEGSALFSIIGLLLSNNLAFIILLLISLAVMLLYYPSPTKIGQEIELTQTEIDTLTI